jgi:hypothetical protein
LQNKTSCFFDVTNHIMPNLLYRDI